MSSTLERGGRAQRNRWAFFNGLMKRINCALLALGFRPFFLMAGLFAVVLMGVWSTAFVTNHALATYYGMVGWHSHETIFGYAAAVIAGFLLTAVGNWTGMRTTSEAPLAGLIALWLAGRVAPFFPDGIPPWFVALLDLLFLPALALAVAIPLVRSGQRRNLFFISLLGAFALANLLVHLEVQGFAEGFARAGIFLGLDLIILLIVIMGGRVIPFFTERALSGVRPRRRPWVEWLSIASVIAWILADEGLQIHGLCFRPDQPRCRGARDSADFFYKLASATRGSGGRALDPLFCNLSRGLRADLN